MFAPLEDLEDELIAFFAVLAHQCLDVFDGGCFQRLEAVALVYRLYDADDVFALAHVSRQKVAHAAGWLCFRGRHGRPSYLKCASVVECRSPISFSLSSLRMMDGGAQQATS